MSATELAVVINYVVTLQQQCQQLQGRIETLEGHSSITDRHLSNLQTSHTQLRSDHDCLLHQVQLELSQALEDAANLKSLAVEESDYCEQRALAECWSQRYPEAFS